MRAFLVVLMAAGAFAVPGLAEKNTQAPKTYSLSELVTLSLGYVQVRPNVLMIETEDEGTYFCRISLSDAEFDAFEARGSDGLSDEAGYTCMSIEDLER